LVDGSLEGCRDRHLRGSWGSSWGGLAVPEGDGRGKQCKRRCVKAGALPGRAPGKAGAQAVGLTARGGEGAEHVHAVILCGPLAAARMLRTISSYWSGLNPCDRKAATSS